MIGGGVAGLSAAWLLSKQHRVTLYEKNPWLGGHANTVDVETPEGGAAVDTGFIVFNPGNYPNFTAMLEHLGVASVDTTMSLGVSLRGGALEYSSDPIGLFGQPRNFVRPGFWRMLGDLLRFYAHARSLDEDGVDGMSLAGFLETEGYSATLVDDHILPMCAAIWSTTPQQMRDYPMRSFLRFFTSHGLLQVANRPLWRTVAGGSRSYVEALRADMGQTTEFRPGARRVTRQGGLSLVEDESGATEFFSDVVIGAHADEALRLLSDPSDDERDILGAFTYTPNTAVLHDDRSLMPKRRAVWAAWNYIGGDQDEDGERPLCVSYWMNRLQRLPTKRQLFVTLNPTHEPDPSRVIRSFEYEHPLFDASALAAQERLWELQGQRNTWFCGSYFGYGFHEDALQSGVAVAGALGVDAPWGEKPARIARAVPLPSETLQAAE